jgi:CxxC motif-containing protein
MGCKMNVEISDGEVVKVENAGCERGRDYGVQEVKSPVRDFFTTVRVEGGRIPILSVRSTRPVPKNMLMACASEMAKVVVSAPIRLGDTITNNILNLGIDIIATKDVEKA